MRNLSIEEFIKRAKKVHGNAYNYSLTEYKDLETKVKIICPIHGIFEQRPFSHFSGQGCPACSKNKISVARKQRNDISGKREPLNTEKFIEKAQKIHGDTYDYSLSAYKRSNIRVTIICPIHGIFEQTPNNHLRGQGCRLCSLKNRHASEDLKRNFINKATNIHGNLYDYSLVEYKNAREKIKIICPVHGIFEQTPNSHINNKYGCPSCGFERTIASTRSNTQEFIKRSEKIHNTFYDYSLVEYLGNLHKIKIICPIHGMFEQTPKSHLRRHGCPSCASSAGENEIEKILLEKNMFFEKQKTFENCIYKYKLRFDFYLPESNTLIEYHGIQHYETVEYFGGIKGFKERQRRDFIKKEFANKNNFNFIEISYKENIKEVLNESL